ncbi:MAG: non-homologous end-joining DNA ligase [Verrucomicrobia subdivision 3 bacterium]|nr:non-homologous end-joining DNA ligase [Limisphaerales bacterium]
MKKESELLVDGRRLPVSNLDKVFYPKTGFTKGDVIDYYIPIAPVLLPHLKDRPLTLKRYPNGVAGSFFYEKRCPTFRPKWLKTAAIWSEGHQEHIHFCLVNDRAALVWAANLADLELHTLLSKKQNPLRPTMMVFDLDPGPPANILNCVQVAFWLKAALDGMGLKSFAKTTGSKGLQLYVPLNTPVTFDQTKRLAEGLAREHPNEVVYAMKKSLRKGKVLIDWSQNDDHKTTVCVYSLRAQERPAISTPVTWQELKKAAKTGNSELLLFDSEAVLRRVQKLGDLFEPVLTMKQRLPALDRGAPQTATSKSSKSPKS